MTVTLGDVPAKKGSVPSAEAEAAKELVRLAKEHGLSLTGPDGLLKQFTKNVLETAFHEETTEPTSRSAAGPRHSPTHGPAPPSSTGSPSPARSSKPARPATGSRTHVPHGWQAIAIAAT